MKLTLKNHMNTNELKKRVNSLSGCEFRWEAEWFIFRPGPGAALFIEHDEHNRMTVFVKWARWTIKTVRWHHEHSETATEKPADPRTGGTETEFILGQTDRIRSRPNVLNSGGETAVECVTERKTSWHHSWLMTPLWLHHFLVIVNGRMGENIMSRAPPACCAADCY